MNPKLALIPAGLLLAVAASTPVSALPPNPCFVVTPAAGNRLTSFSVDASCSTHPVPLTNLEVRWDWEDDNVYDTTFTTTKTASHTYGTAGTKTIRAEVRDPLTGDTATTTRQVTVVAQKATSYGHIWITNTGSGPMVREDYTAKGWSCSNTTAGPVVVTCAAPAPPTGFDGWHCTGLAVSAAALTPGSSVKGRVECHTLNGGSTFAQTADLYGPNATATASAPFLADTINIVCKALPVSNNSAPAASYSVTCSEP